MANKLLTPLILRPNSFLATVMPGKSNNAVIAGAQVQFYSTFIKESRTVMVGYRK